MTKTQALELTEQARMAGIPTDEPSLEFGSWRATIAGHGWMCYEDAQEAVARAVRRMQPEG